MILNPNIRIVLVDTTHPGNIGAVARAMKNMGLFRLSLVSPKIYPHVDATARASGADDVLANAEVFDSLESALSGCGLVIGASARPRSITWPQLTPRECAQMSVSESATCPVAIVFGREHSGLTNSEMDHCHYLVQIPTNPDYSSLNIASAAQVITYEILLASQQPVIDTQDSLESLSTSGEMDYFYQHLEQVLLEVEFLDPDSPKHLKRLMRRLRRLYNRARPDNNELNILHGILTAIQTFKGTR